MPEKSKHLIVIHGRATKPSSKEKKRLVKKSLIHGLERVSPQAAQKLKNGEIRFSLAYYGDICNREMIRADEKEKSELPDKDPAHGNSPCEKAGSYDADLAKLFQTTNFSRAAYKKLIRKATPDMGAYLTRRSVGSEIRERLQRHLKPSLTRG